MSDFILSLYDEEDNPIGGFSRYGSTFLPAPGMILLANGGAWEVASPPQILLAEPGSIAAADNSPFRADVRVRLADGIHDQAWLLWATRNGQKQWSGPYGSQEEAARAAMINHHCQETGYTIITGRLEHRRRPAAAGQ